MPLASSATKPSWMPASSDFKFRGAPSPHPGSQHHQQAPLQRDLRAAPIFLSHYSTVVGGAAGDNRRIQGLVCGCFGDETNPHMSSSTPVPYPAA